MRPSARNIAFIGFSLWVTGSAPALAATAGSPYGSISARNVFALKDPPSPPAAVVPPIDPPAITLQGFATVLGKRQVLFKVAMPARPPQPAVELARIMSEGERDGEITVLEINQAEGSVKFDNHGTIEVKTMKDHAAKPENLPPAVAMTTMQAAVVADSLGVPRAPGFAVTPQPSAAGGAAVLGSGMSARATAAQGATSRRVRTTPYGIASSGNVSATPPPPPGVNWPPESRLSPEEQEAMIAVQQELHKDDPNFPPVPGSYLPPNKQNQQDAPPPRPQ